MRVLVVEDDLHPHGGQERSLLACTAGLAQRGHHIDLLYRAPGENFAEYRTFCRTMTRIPGHLIDGQVPARSILRWLRSIRIARRGTQDIVYINQHQDSPFGAAVAILKHIPLVCHLRQPPPAGRGIQWTLARSKIAHYIAVSSHTRAQYLARGVRPTRIDVVHNGIDLDQYREPEASQSAAFRRAHGIPLDAFVVLYAGRLDREKGIEILIDAFNLLDLPPEKGRLIIAGAPRNHRDAHAAQAYQAALHTRSRLGSTVWLDWQAHTCPLYGAADVAVLPSLTDEPMARTPLEAMACRRPALISAVGAASEILTGAFTQFLFPPSDPPALAAALRTVHDWQRHDPDLGQACREYIRNNFSLKRTVDGVEQILLRVLAGQQCQDG